MYAPNISISPRGMVAGLVALAMMLGIFALSPAAGTPLNVPTAHAQVSSGSQGSSKQSGTKANATDVGERTGNDISGFVKGLVPALLGVVFLIAAVKREVGPALAAGALGILALVVLQQDVTDAIVGGVGDTLTGK